MIKQHELFPVIKELTQNEERDVASKLLDTLFKRCRTLEDFETIGACALEVKYADLYLTCAIRCYSLSVNNQELYTSRENLYKAYITNNYPEKALFYININLAIDPDDITALSHKAVAYNLLNRRTEAEEILLKILDSDHPEKEKHRFSLSNKYLREGQIAKGIDYYIHADKPKNHLFEDHLRLKFWDGIIQPGKTIIVNAEGGIGDEFINIRFLNRFKQIGMNPILYSSWHMYRPDLVNLFRRHGYKVTTNHLFFNKSDLWTHMLSLPVYFNLSEKNLWQGPYIHALRNSKNELYDNKFKIGIKVNGNRYFEQDVYRRIPIDELLAVLPKNASIYYIDNEREYEGTISLKNKIQSWEDTLDFIDQMDIIISSCTSLPHVAGAMGKKTIVIVPILEYYTWTSTRKDDTTPWYGDNFTVLRQEKLRSWTEPLLKIKHILDNTQKENQK